MWSMGTYLNIALGLGVGILVVTQGAMNARLTTVLGNHRLPIERKAEA